MTKKSLRSQVNQIRTWVQQGRTDAWIAHQLGVDASEIDAVKKEHELETGEQAKDGVSAEPSKDEAADLRAKDEAKIAAELEKDAEVRKKEADEAAKRGSKIYEGTFDHGEEGYGLWLDPSVQDDPVYAEHWAGHRQVEVSIKNDEIIIRRAV